MQTERLDLVDGLRRQYRALRLCYLVSLAAAVLALVFFFVDRRATLALVAFSLIFHLAVTRRRGRAPTKAPQTSAIPKLTNQIERKDRQ